MPPKKVVEEQKILLGRPGNNLQMGIVGLPNVGKSTLFNTLCKMNIPASNFPFCTIDPNLSRVAVPDARYDWLCEHWKPASEVPAYLQVTDIAGLVKGAANGEGLGNAFLSHISAVDGIFHCVRVFEDKDVTHTEESVDPVRDLDIISHELRLKDLEKVKKPYPRLVQLAKSDKTKKREVEVLARLIEMLENNQDARSHNWSNAEAEVVNEYHLLTAKPAVYLVNMSEKDFFRKKNKWLGKIKAWIDSHGGGKIIPFSCAFEDKIVQLAAEDPASAEQYIKDSGCESSIPKIILTGYHAMNLVHFFTCGTDEVRCWTVRKDSKAPQAAGVIHTDFEKAFISAEVMPYAAYNEHGSEAATKKAGQWRQQGKGYVVQDGDIIFFKAGQVNAGKKK
eukprot:TRINITY_DN15013_c1_g1_i1.p1 TRINITY_DN15013_c1_g1~~TRINITY_DN15013_c1_g1_i1.p1  ORF type:complete len:404 (+),score=134.15 TRINITY_DN15013_c1_g1_i1:36-1214(+)